MPKITQNVISEIPFTIEGIPCIIAVTYFHHTKPRPNCTSSDIDFYGETEIEYTITDRKDYIAKWLSKKITPAIDMEIINLIKDTLANEE